MDEFVTLATKYDPKKNNIDNWYCSEKLDGIRCLYHHGIFYTRHGNEIAVPQFFQNSIKEITKGNDIDSNIIDVSLDGELWSERGSFEKIFGTVSKKVPIDSEWSQIKFIVFDSPTIKGTYKERYNSLKLLLEGASAGPIKLIDNFIVHNKEEVQKYLDQYIKIGAEGLILRNPQAPYENGRSKNLLKVKVHQDAEAEILDYEISNNGRCKGMVGSYIVKALKSYDGPKEGLVFEIGSGLTNEQRTIDGPQFMPPGTKVTYKFTGFTKYGKPKHTRIIKIIQ